MVFSTVSFLFYFLPIFLVLYAFAPTRNMVLLAASLIFYAWGEPIYVLLLLVSVGVNYLAGLWVAARPGDRLPLLFGVAANLGMLGYFKYANLLVGSLNSLTSEIGGTSMDWTPVALPLGISFYSFQAMSYLIDVHRGHAQVERSPAALAVYLAMFPQLVAGPIVRFASVAKQINRRNHTFDRATLGLSFFIIGLSQKVLIANTIAVAVDGIFALEASHLSTPLAWAGMVGYTLQIYFDFNGYSNMAIGLGLVLAFKFPRNFNYPYISTSVTEFWRRWHISLSGWFRDYLYIPLGGNRQGPWRTSFNLATVFLLCGLWHGASWTFLVWGLYHGLLLSVERWGLNRLLQCLPLLVRHLYLLLAIMFGWVIFRADNFEQLGHYYSALFGFSDIGVELPVLLFFTQDVLIACVIAVVASTPWHRSKRLRLHNRAVAVSLSSSWLLILFVLCLTFVASGSYNPFIYFRF